MDNKHKRIYKIIKLYDAFLYITFEINHGLIGLDFFSFSTQTISKKEISTYSTQSATLIDKVVTLVERYANSNGDELKSLQPELVSTGKTLVKQYEKITADFIVRSWKRLLELPIGKVTSYLDIAQKLKQPKAVRSVGRVLAHNPLCIVVPCHRIVPKISTDRLNKKPNIPLSLEEVGHYGGGRHIKYKLIMHEGHGST